MQSTMTVSHSMVHAVAAMGLPLGSPSQHARFERTASSSEPQSSEEGELQRNVREGVKDCLELFKRWSKASTHCQEAENKYIKMKAFEGRNILPENRDRIETLKTENHNAAHDLVEKERALKQRIEALLEGSFEHILNNSVRDSATVNGQSQGITQRAGSCTGTVADRSSSESGFLAEADDRSSRSENGIVKPIDFFDKLAELMGTEKRDVKDRLLAMAKRSLDADAAKDAAMDEDAPNGHISSTARQNSGTGDHQAIMTKRESDTTCADLIGPNERAGQKFLDDFEGFRQDVEARLQTSEQRACDAERRMFAQEQALETLLQNFHEQADVVRRQAVLIGEQRAILQNHITALARHEEFIDRTARLSGDLPSPLTADAEEHLSFP